MEIDFEAGKSLAVYGDNGTGKSTIADALEWFFTGGIELLSHEGRQHAIKNLGPAAEGETAVELVTSGSLGGKVAFPDERGPEAFGVASRETFLLRGRTLADFINKTKTEKWKALAELLGLDAVELLRQDLQRARSDIKKQVKAAEDRIASSKQALSAGSDEERTRRACSRSAAVSESTCRSLSIRYPSPPGSPGSSGEAKADPKWRVWPRRSPVLHHPASIWRRSGRGTSWCPRKAPRTSRVSLFIRMPTLSCPPPPTTARFAPSRWTERSSRRRSGRP